MATAGSDDELSVAGRARTLILGICHDREARLCVVKREVRTFKTTTKDLLALSRRPGDPGQTLGRVDAS